MEYHLSYDNSLTHFIDIKLFISDINKDITTLKLPIWRPGRYEAANYAKNIQKIWASNAEDESIEIVKNGPTEWSIDTSAVDRIEVNYRYFAFAMDAGNSFLDENQLYINFINCMLYDPERMDEECKVSLDIPPSYEIACGMQPQGNVLVARDYYQLVDSPLIASDSLTHVTYNINDVIFHIWVQGDFEMDKQKLIADFKQFSEYQINVLGTFPSKDYHFLIQALPYRFYHGVEHGNSTVITLGPAEDLQKSSLYNELLGVSSHELFHAWNILKIRPKELLPYDFNTIPVFSTGFVAEGFTTYYGDLFLVRSSALDKDWYFSELNKLFSRHFLNYGRLVNSVVDSSIDLWFDGYQISAPNKKSSIYVEGAMSALLLDLSIREITDNKKSLDDVVRLLWHEYGQKGKGYVSKDIESLAQQVAGQSLKKFFESYVYGVEPKETYLAKMLNTVGCSLEINDSPNLLERCFGVKLGSTAATNRKVILIAPDSVGELHLSLQDEILKVNGESATNYDFNKEVGHFDFEIKRNHRIIKLSLDGNDHSFIKQYSIKELPNQTKKQQESFNKWLDV